MARSPFGLLALLCVLTTVHRGEGQRRTPNLALDVGEGWVPPLFAQDRSTFRPIYVALAQERFDALPGDLGVRAARVRYVEVYGVAPTLSVLRRRLAAVTQRACDVDHDAIVAFGRRRNAAAGLGALDADDERQAERRIFRNEELRLRGALAGRTERTLDRHQRAMTQRLREWRRGLQAVRQRLACEGFLRGTVPTTPSIDWKTEAAIAEFARRHRIYARGELQGSVLEALAASPEELERRALVRVLSERARLDWGILADGTGTADNELARVRAHLEAQLAIGTVEGARTFLDELGTIPERRLLSIEGFALPESHGSNLELEVVIDRGDVRYDPPFDSEGQRIDQAPLEHPPTLELRNTTTGESLVRWPTTIGGWRQERSGDSVVWRYKESPVGRGHWERIVAAPVWLPPASTPDESLRVEDASTGQTVLRRTLLGPGYASAYGLVAAIHRRRVGARTTDEGIRTHGSVDYTSVFGDFSHGCHRLQNHRAVALFSYLIAHRNHRYEGPVRADYRRVVDLGDRRETLNVEVRGERFVLDPPIRFEVREGRILGDLRRPSDDAFPVASGASD
ncbi:MAG: hypothetical protein AAF411_01355 [Myxococcota bacterium]